MEKKTIIINPELLKIKKTRKNKPTISPKLIKRKLLKRIKDHDNTDKNDFRDSETFLTSILNKKNKTVKNPQPISEYKDLTPIHKNVENILFKTTGTPLNLNYKIDDETPHGCLKNGIKQCYRSYKNFPQKINHTFTPLQSDENIAKRIIESEINKAINGKTEFSDIINKSDSLTILEDVSIEPDLLKTNSLECFKEPPLETFKEPPLESFKDESLESLIMEESIAANESESSEPVQVQRTIKRKFTLGKNKNKIGVLIKNKRTKKNVLDYTKDLKKITTEEIKKYLRDHGLIKVGSSAPPEIVRKIFENTKMSGDIINESKDILNSLINENNSEIYGSQ